MEEPIAIAEEDLTEEGDTIQMVSFELEGELFGVDILMVQEIIKQMPITVIPDAPDFIAGVINLRGRIVPVIDLRKRLNLKVDNQVPAQDAWTLILNAAGRVTGFIVDQVTRVIKVPVNAIQPPAEKISSSIESDYLSGVCKSEEQPAMTILDFNRIIAVDEFKRLGAQKRLRIKS
ncbi:MAG: purine-binding chemotaxis protein CheW [Desulfatitalea sp.]|nr:purine-binding chemotaxis protein CheW [Desulfatitalea sp.]